MIIILKWALRFVVPSLIHPHHPSPITSNVIMYKLFETISSIHFRVYWGNSFLMGVKFKAVSTRKRGEILQQNCAFRCKIGFQSIRFKHECIITLGWYFYSELKKGVNVKLHWIITLFYTGSFQLLIKTIILKIS